MYDQKGRHGKERLRRYLMNRITKGKRQQKIGNERKKNFFRQSQDWTVTYYKSKMTPTF